MMQAPITAASAPITSHFGFTLDEAVECLALIDNNAVSCTHVAEKVNEKVKQIGQKIAELLELRTALINMVNTCINRYQPVNPEGNCPILVTNTFKQTL